MINLKEKSASNLPLRAAYSPNLRYHFRRIFIFRRDYFFKSQGQTARGNSTKSATGYLKRRDKDYAALRADFDFNGRHDDE